MQRPALLLVLACLAASLFGVGGGDLAASVPRPRRSWLPATAALVVVVALGCSLVPSASAASVAMSDSMLVGLADTLAFVSSAFSRVSFLMNKLSSSCFTSQIIISTQYRTLAAQSLNADEMQNIYDDADVTPKTISGAARVFVFVFILFFIFL